jgi:serine/threonine protein kinase
MENTKEGFTLKLADFGHASIVPPGTLFHMPHTKPWQAPEYDEFAEISSKQAYTMEVFSYGLVCFMVLFVNGADCSYSELLRNIEVLKGEEGVLEYSTKLLRLSSGCNANERETILLLLHSTLESGSEKRCADFTSLSQLLNQTE